MIVTGATFRTSAVRVASAVGAFGVASDADGSEEDSTIAFIDSTAGLFLVGAAAGVFVAVVVADVVATFFFASSAAATFMVFCDGAFVSGGSPVLPTSDPSDGWRAAIIATTAAMQITPRTIATGLFAQDVRMGSSVRTGFFARIDRVRFFPFFARTYILLSEILRSVRSAESKY